VSSRKVLENEGHMDPVSQSSQSTYSSFVPSHWYCLGFPIYQYFMHSNACEKCHTTGAFFSSFTNKHWPDALVSLRLFQGFCTCNHLSSSCNRLLNLPSMQGMIQCWQSIGANCSSRKRNTYITYVFTEFWGVYIHTHTHQARKQALFRKNNN
jgi:hypothetical protein